MSRLNALADKSSGSEAFGLANYDNLQTDIGYLIEPGAAVASAGTVDITNEWTPVTGTTTIDNIGDTEGATAGQQVRLFLENGPVTIRNNGGGAGNIRTITGLDTSYPQDTIVTLVYDGTVWREQGASLRPGAELDYKQITADVTGITATTEAAAIAVITGNAIVCDGSKVKIEFFAPSSYGSTAGNEGHYVILCDTTVIGQFEQIPENMSADRGSSVNGEVFYTPAAGTHTFAVKAYTGTGQTLNVSAGAGGAGTLMPAFLRVTKA